jgi:GTP-binding protein
MRREGYELAVSKPRVSSTKGTANAWSRSSSSPPTSRTSTRAPSCRRSASARRAREHGVRTAWAGCASNTDPGARADRLQNEFLNLTRGTGLISNIFDSYEPYKGEIEGRKNGVLISQDDGEAVTYSLGKLDDRGRMFVKAATRCTKAW